MPTSPVVALQQVSVSKLFWITCEIPSSKAHSFHFSQLIMCKSYLPNSCTLAHRLSMPAGSLSCGPSSWWTPTGTKRRSPPSGLLDSPPPLHLQVLSSSLRNALALALASALALALALCPDAVCPCLCPCPCPCSCPWLCPCLLVLALASPPLLCLCPCTCPSPWPCLCSCPCP